MPEIGRATRGSIDYAKLSRFSREHLEEVVAEFFPKAPRRRVQDFLVIGTRREAHLPPVCIFHVPGGLWAGFTTRFEDAVNRLLEHPEQDQEFITTIYNV